MRLSNDTIAIIDFGGQYAHLISRRVRDLRIYSEVVPYDNAVDSLKKVAGLKGIIFSGGPASIYGIASPKIDKDVYELGVPILGICYGHQLIGSHFQGVVSRGDFKEYGKTLLAIESENILFEGVKKETFVWMSHSDQVLQLPEGFINLARTKNTKYAAFYSPTRSMYGVQFHPEVIHTNEGKKIIENFLFKICESKPSWKISSFVSKAVRDIEFKYVDGKVICAVSGGLDSTVTAVLMKQVVKERLLCVFVNNGLLRKGEPEEVIRELTALDLNPIYVDASSEFLSRLKNIVDPELKRKIVGETFIEVFDGIAQKHGPIRYLAQGTLYPDVIESARSTGPASTIKTHHNVGGLPLKLSYDLIEPLRNLYKDEVRKVAKIMHLPDSIIRRHPFPGPGLAARIIGEVTPEKLSVVRDASAIVEEELKASGYYNKVWQAFAYVGDDKAVGVVGDQRMFGYIVTVKVVSSQDGMTADWVKLPHKLTEKISARITNEVKNVSSVSYCISSKPPATIEPQ